MEHKKQKHLKHYNASSMQRAIFSALRVPYGMIHSPHITLVIMKESELHVQSQSLIDACVYCIAASYTTATIALKASRGMSGCRLLMHL